VLTRPCFALGGVFAIIVNRVIYSYLSIRLIEKIVSAMPRSSVCVLLCLAVVEVASFAARVNGIPSLGGRTRARIPSLGGRTRALRVVASAGLGGVDKQLSSETLITYASISDEFKPLVLTALAKLDRGRVMQGKPKYETVEGMIDAYVEESRSAGLDWTREESESEVVRYLQRQALANEGGITGDGQDKAAFALLFLLVGLLGAQGAQWAGLVG
jgi:hypothetical protein